jgi:hypothetical protein
MIVITPPYFGLSEVAGVVVATPLVGGFVVGAVEVAGDVVAVCGLPQETRKRSIAAAQVRKISPGLRFISSLYSSKFRCLLTCLQGKNSASRIAHDPASVKQITLQY